MVRTVLSLPRARVQSLVGELKSHKPHGEAKKKREGERENVILLISHIRKFTLTHVP